VRTAPRWRTVASGIYDANGLIPEGGLYLLVRASESSAQNQGTRGRAEAARAGP